MTTTTTNLAGLPDLLTVEEAAAVLRTSRSTAYELTQLYRANPQTGLPVLRIGRRLRVPKRSLLAMLDSVANMSPGVAADDHRSI